MHKSPPSRTVYFLSHPIFGEKEVSKKEFIAAERQAGFHSKFGPDECATGGFGVSGGLSGSVRYVKEEN